MKVLTNALGICDSGGLTVFNSYLKESSSEANEVFIVYNNSPLINEVVNHYRGCTNLKFIQCERSGFIKRCWIEHFIFKKIITSNNIDIIYNFSGSAQFIKIPQLIKLQNLMFFSKDLDKNYINQKQVLKWIKQIFFKRIVLLFFYRFQHFFEIQSSHVKNAVLDFLPEKGKTFFIKSDFEANFFSPPKDYQFSEKVTFLFIVGPHFQVIHKNLSVFVKAMLLLLKKGANFEIVITLDRAQLEQSPIWDKNLNPVTTFLGYTSSDDLQKQFKNNTILISTSIVETIGLHVIEAIRHGCLSIVPDEPYSQAVYGSDLPKFNSNDPSALMEAAFLVLKMNTEECQAIIKKSQDFITHNEKTKFQHVFEIFNLIKPNPSP